MTLSGQLETTLIQSFIRNAKLRRWMGSPDSPHAIRRAEDVFKKLILAPRSVSSANGALEGSNADESEEDSLMDLGTDDESNTERETSVPPVLRRFLRSDNVHLLARVKLHGVFFCRASTHLGNSLILFHRHGNVSAEAIPASIEYIFTRNDKTCFAVRSQLPVEMGTLDPFSFYEDFPCRLYSSRLSDELEIVEIEWVKCHFARFPMSLEHVAVLSLSKACSMFSPRCHRFDLRPCSTN